MTRVVVWSIRVKRDARCPRVLMMARGVTCPILSPVMIPLAVIVQMIAVVGRNFMMGMISVVLVLIVIAGKVLCLVARPTTMITGVNDLVYSGR